MNVKNRILKLFTLNTSLVTEFVFVFHHGIYDPKWKKTLVTYNPESFERSSYETDKRFTIQI